MYQYLLHKVKWLAWYTKTKINYGAKKHTITMSLGNFKGNRGTANVYISANGNGIVAKFCQIQLTPSHSNGLHDFATVSDAVLPIDISSLTFHRDGIYESEWFVRWITIDKKQNQRFNIYKWIKPDIHYSSREDTNLPQDENSQCTLTREKHLAKKRHEYEFDLYQNDPFVPVKIAKLPKDEKFSWKYRFKYILYPALITDLSQAFIRCTHRFPERWSSFNQITKAYHMYFKIPTGIDHWEDDQHFAQQRLNWCNWSLIERVVSKAVLQNMMTVDEIRLNKLMSEGIVEMISQDRLFVTNLKMTDGLGIPSPVVLFQQTTHSGLVPVAIQLNQPEDKSNKTNPVFYPDDDTNVWKLAKMWCNLADSSIHLGIVHLGLTHLLMEGVNISMHRNLSTRHPVYKLLAPHFHYTLAINELARLDLLGPGEYVDRIIKIKSAGVLVELGKKLEVWRMDIDGTLPADLRKRGLLYPDENENEKINLPGFFYAEDGLRLYYAIREYVDEYVRYYYAGEDDNETKQRLFDDAKIHAFCRELQKPRAFVDGGIGIKGVPSTNNKFETIEQLTDTITSIIYTCSVMHAATNNPMYDEYGFPPNYSTMLHKEPPSDAKPMSDQDVLDCLPTVAETFDMMTIFTRLSQETTKPLGEFEVQYIEDEGAVKILDKFRSKLAKIGMDIEKRNEKIKEENKRRKADNEIVYQRPYTILLPKNVPNSIAI